jgi:hypothetical protein
MFVEMKCAYCGKPFFPTKYHAYKIGAESHKKLFCKYSCMLRYREKHQKIKEEVKQWTSSRS